MSSKAFFSWFLKPVPKDVAFVLKWTCIIGVPTGLLGALFTLMGLHGGIGMKYVAGTLMPSLWIFFNDWIYTNNFVTMFEVSIALHLLMVSIIVIALKMGLKRLTTAFKR